MRHFVFLLYLLSYVAGIGAIALGLFLYQFKLKNRILKCFLCMDIFLTIILSVDTVYYYGELFGFTSQRAFVVFSIYMMMFANLATMAFLTLGTSALVGEEVSYRQKAVLLVTSLSSLITIGLLQTLNFQGYINGRVAAHSAFFAVNAFGGLILYYNGFFVWKNWDKVNSALKPMVETIMLVTVFLETASILYDLLKYFWSPGFSTAFSPIIYFCGNVLALWFGGRFKFGQPAVSDQPEPAGIPQPDYATLCSAYGITERELEIMLLVAGGHSNQDIGAKLFITLNTVRNHIYNIYKKLGIKNRYELISLINDLKTISGHNNSGASQGM